MSEASNSIARGVSVVAVAAFLGVLGWYLFQPGYGWTRLALFAALGAFAVAGSAGVWYGRARVAAAGIAGLVLLTVTLAGTLWMFVLPVVIVLVAATAVTSNHERTNTPSVG
ncbi:hypothetical protein [Halobacterium litoreum]|uniref:Uncharacterized protein n=1 Tax=Halobacterium litoreum TaxID=2039234 RepID=A0ABD5NGA2_9EURY|nr:hypothetical protein [Halobacterium litoreum]UHH12892.1 hypothetical protein LT972_12080 [Halobacterium litoreum]